MNTKLFYTALVSLMCSVFCLEAKAQTTLYVNQTATGLNDGTTWVNAYTDLQTALDVAVVGNEVWVAAGTYNPTEATDDVNTVSQNRAFHFNKDISVYGGFVGTETLLSERQKGNETILDGNIGLSNSANDNCYHVLLTTSLTNSAIIDGFTIANGNASENDNNYIQVFYGTARYYSYEGAGMSNISSSPTINNVVFKNNTSNRNGGAMRNLESSPIIKNVFFDNNTADDFGGAIYNYDNSSPTITNTLFTNNTAQDGGGAIFNDEDSSPIIKNATFANNTSVSANGQLRGGGAIGNYVNSFPEIYNSAFFNNKAGGVINDIYSTSNNASVGTIKGTHNGSDDPNVIGYEQANFSDPFVDSTDVDGADDIYGTPDDGFYPINSRLEDSGWNGYNAEPYDLGGNDRIINTTIDIGAYEYFAQERTLITIATNGTVTADVQPINGVYTDGQAIVLTATPAAGYVFTGWSGDASGITNPLSVTMDADKTITATFSLIEYTLTTTIVGNGSVSADVQPTNGVYSYGQVVTLTATPDTGNGFTGWSGDITDTTNSIVITIDADKTITATFDATANTVDNVFNNQIKVYPNPVINTLKIEVATGETLKNVQVFTLLGKKVIETNNHTVDFSTISKGIYLLKIESENGKIAVRKIVKE